MFSLPEMNGIGQLHDFLTLRYVRPGQKVRPLLEAVSPGSAVIRMTSSGFKRWR
jgi:hypothetical protein